MRIRGGWVLSVVVFLFIAIVILGSSISFAAVQQEPYTLRPFLPAFPFKETSFNDSATSHEGDYPMSGGSLTYYVRLPRNGTVTDALIDLHGKIVPIYNRSVNSGTYGLLGISIGDVVGDGGNEIATGTNNLENVLRVLHGNNGSLVWSMGVGSSNNRILSTSIGNVTNDDGNEIVIGSQDNRVYVINAADSGGSTAWSFDTNGDVNSVAVGDLESDGNEVIAGSASGFVYALWYNGTQRWSQSVNGINSVVVANITNDPGNEVLVGASGGVYVINSGGSIVWNRAVGGGTEVKTIAVGNVTNDAGNEIAVGAADNRTYLLNSTGYQIWNYTTGDQVSSAIISDVTDEPDVEIVAGSDDGKIYTIKSDGTLVWEYLTESFVRSVEAGNLTSDPGNEVAAASTDGYLYVFNFDYFPSNLSVDIGGNGTSDWNMTGKLRNTTTATIPASAFNYELLNNCSQSPCNISMVFRSDNIGKLNVSNVNISFNYNASHVLSVTNVSAWSRVTDVSANETVGNYTNLIGYTGVHPEYAINVSYLKVNDGSTSCDFNLTSRTVSTINGSKVCLITNFTIGTTGGLPSAAYLWDSTMDASMPFVMNETVVGFTNTTDNYYWRKNVTIWKNFAGVTVFYNLTGNASLDNPSVTGNEYLNVSWLGYSCDITPSSQTATCDEASPAYAQKMCGGDVFYVCKEDTNSDGIVDFFKWKQPNTSSGSSWSYQVGGETDKLPNLSDANITIDTYYWGSWFNYSVFINDTDGDKVSARLWYYLENQSAWVNGGLVNVTGEGTAWFNLTSNQGWIGNNTYKFQYADFNASGSQLHGWTNTSNFTGPNVTKRVPAVLHVYGDQQPVNSSATIRLVAQVNDTVTGQSAGSGVDCVFWVQYNTSAWAPGNYTTTNSSGQCLYDFTPDGNFTVGNLTWKAGVLGDPNYTNTNSSGFNVTLKGLISASFNAPLENQTVYRNSSNYIEAHLVDHYGRDLNISGYTCTLFVSGIMINASTTNQTGFCNFTWNPACNTSFTIGNRNMSVNLTGSATDYLIENQGEQINIRMKDSLTMNVFNPPAYALYNKGGTVPLNSTVNDTCLQCGTGYNVTWFVKWKDWFYINLTGDAVSHYNETFVINGSLLEQDNIQLSKWEIAKTGVYYNDTLVVSDVLPWNDSGHLALNESQVYMNNLSELVFYFDLPANTNRSYLVRFNQTAPDMNIPFIENSGFESGSVSPSTCIQYNCNPTVKACSCEVVQEGTEQNGSLSLYLSAESSGADNGNIMGVQMPVRRNVSTNYITVKYKAWGTFCDGSYVSIKSGGGICNLSLPCETAQEEAAWNLTTCYNTSFNGADSINITIHDYGDGGPGVEASHIYIDYVCVSNQSGGCMGYNPFLVSGLESQTEVWNQTNGTWTIGGNEDVGLRTVVGNASGEFYLTDLENRDIYIYGWSNLSNINMSSPYCTYNDSMFSCMQNATLYLYCLVKDYNTSLPVYNHNVSFFDEDGNGIGSNTTNTSGFSVFRWDNSSGVPGMHNWSCNITGDETSFYNITAFNNLSMEFNISTGNTTGLLIQEPQTSVSATGVNLTYNHTFQINISLVNTGSESMYNTTMLINTTDGVYYQTPECPPLLPNENCSRTITLDVTYLADPGYYNVTINASWSNADMSHDTLSNSTPLYIDTNVVLDVVQDEINYTIARGGSFEVGNMTILSAGNSPLNIVNFTLSGANATNISSWLDFNPVGFVVVARGTSSNTTLSLSVPENTAIGVYTASVYANATGSICSPATKCWDHLTFNVNVTEVDWEVNRENFTKTIGSPPVNGTFYPSLIITNNKESSYPFLLTVEGNLNYTSLSNTSFTLGPYESKTIYIRHNTSAGYAPGDYQFNVTIDNTNTTAVPDSLNVTVTLTVINLSVVILSPNTISPIGPVNSSILVNITVNASLSGNATELEGNMTWSATIGGEECTGLTSSFNSTSEKWALSCYTPLLAGNPLLADLNVTGYYVGGLNVSDIQASAVRYQDITPPVINHFSLLSSDFEGNVLNGSLSTLSFLVNISDNDFVNSSWAAVLYPNGTIINHTLYNTSVQSWRFNFTNPNMTGDYIVTVYANDSAGLANHSQSPMGYFDVYTTLQFFGQIRDKNGNNLSANFSLYGPGTNWKVHNFSTNYTNNTFNWTLHNREYDLTVQIGDDIITFYNTSARYSAQAQYNTTIPLNWTNPFMFDSFPNESSPDITNFNLPATARYRIMGFAVNTTNLTYTSAYVTVNYTEALSVFMENPRDVSENNFEVLYCADWNFDSRECGTGGQSNFSYLNESANPNVSANTFSFPAPGFSAFMIAQACRGGGGSLIDCTGYEPGGGDEGGDQGGTGGDSGSGSGSGAGTGTVTPTDVFPFTIVTDASSIRVHPGETKVYRLTVTNKRISENITVSIQVKGLSDVLFPEMSSIYLKANETRTINISATVPEGMSPGTYTGSLTASSGAKSLELPVTMTVTAEGSEFLMMGVDMITQTVEPYGKLRFSVDLRNTGLAKNLNVTMVYSIKNAETGRIITEVNKSVVVNDTLSLREAIDIPGLDYGDYYLDVYAYFGEMSVNKIEVFTVTASFWDSDVGKMFFAIIAVSAVIVFGYFGKRFYVKWKLGRSRYIFPVNYSKIPQELSNSFWVGKVAETDRKAWIQPDDLTTHILIAGSTGAGKSVSASVIVEEALEQKIPVIVFDPTAQWTGFVKSLKDENVTSFYARFGMDPRLAKSYKGLIYEVTDPHMRIDLKKFMIPGEITVFTLNKLEPGEYDIAVQNIVNSVFKVGWEESINLKMLVVFDEVHRLLEKYGGTGGYTSLEKACREFRKWGIGIVMCSQVLADFKEAIAGNVLTEVQFNTKSITDIEKIKSKYGEIYAERISRQGVGVGMIQNPKYNDGKPYFVQFRPTWHNPHKITDEEMETYKRFAKVLAQVERGIADLKEAGKDTFDLEMEFKLATDKLKRGQFRMAQIYITSLQQHLGIKPEEAKDEKKQGDIPGGERDDSGGVRGA